MVLNTLVERCENLRFENAHLMLQRRADCSVGAAGGAALDSHSAIIQSLEQKVYKLQEELTCLHRAKSESADKLFIANNIIQEKEHEILDKNNKISDLQSEIMLLKESFIRQKEEIENLTAHNNLVRDEYNTLNMTYESLNSKFLKLKEENSHLVQRWVEYKSKDAERLNKENELLLKARQQAVAESIREATEDFGAVVIPCEGDVHEVAVGTLTCPYSVLPTACFFTKEVHDSDVHTLSLSNNGRLLATGGEDRKLKLWNVRRDGFSASNTLMGSNGGINCIAFSADDSLVMAACTDNAARIWSVSDLRIRHTFTGHTAKVMACQFTSDANITLTGASDRTIKVWDMRSKACSRTVFVGSSCYDLTVLHASPSLFLSGHHDKNVRIYDLRTKCENEITIHVIDRVTSVSSFHNSNYCLVSCRDDVLRVVDARMKDIVTEYTAEGLHLGSDCTRACVSPDDTYVAVGSGDGVIHVWSVDTGTLATTLTKGHTSCVMACSWSPDGQFFVSGERAKQVMLWANI
ncbi:WD40 repeat [Trinorchestia longiramus]|nr:WD40 repeat [Trinorchestia longiramus]